MAFPFSAMPTLRDFIERAKEQGCKEGRLTNKIIGPRGPVVIRYLVSPSQIVSILPDLHDTDHLAPIQLGHLVRALGVTGYDHCLVPDTYEDDLDWDSEEEN
jgi:hypothetical protein